MRYSFNMNFIGRRLAEILSILGITLAPALALADNQGVNEAPPLRNPLNGVDNLAQLSVKVLDAVVQIGAYVAVLFIIYSGLLFVLAQGNPAKLQSARQTFLYTIIGVAILLAAKAISLGIASTIQSIVG